MASFPATLWLMIRETNWPALLTVATVSAGGYFAQGLPAAIGLGPGATFQTHFQSHFKTYDKDMNEALDGFYFWPGACLVAMSGVVVDRIFDLRMLDMARLAALAYET